jgi:CRP-like cAMP-binding protein
MDDDDLRRLEETSALIDLPAGHVLIERDHHGTGLYFILEGTVVVEAPEGDIELGAHSLVGERALLAEHGRRAARVRATSSVRAIAVDRQHFEGLCAADPAFAERLLATAI